jgi:hypothetical protein
VSSAATSTPPGSSVSGCGNLVVTDGGVADMGAATLAPRAQQRKGARRCIGIRCLYASAPRQGPPVSA